MANERFTNVFEAICDDKAEANVLQLRSTVAMLIQEIIQKDNNKLKILQDNFAPEEVILLQENPIECNLELLIKMQYKLGYAVERNLELLDLSYRSVPRTITEVISRLHHRRIQWNKEEFTYTKLDKDKKND